jgi:hypothetical protein
VLQSTRFAATAAFGLTVVVIGPATHAVDKTGADPIAQLAGRWSGAASVMPASGPSRDFKCVVVYRAAGDGSRLDQKLRCNSGDFKLEAATMLKISGNEVTGRWEDPVNSIGGDVRGIVTAGGFDVHLGGPFFQAQMQVSGGGCEQNVRLIPVKTDYMKELSANLKKC